MRSRPPAAAFGVWLPLLLALAVAPAAASAQATLAPAAMAEEGLRRQEDRARELQQQMQPKSDVLDGRLAVAVPAELPHETPCFFLREIRLAGPDAVRFRWLADSAAPYLHRCAGVAGLRRIAAALDAKLIWKPASPGASSPATPAWSSSSATGAACRGATRRTTCRPRPTAG